MKITFKEKQKLSGWALGFISILLIPLGLLMLYGIYQQIYLGEEFGDKPASDMALFVILLLTIVLFVFFWALNLKTEIDENGIKIRFFLFIKRELRWAQITSAEVIDYGFIGGWGIRFSQKYGTVYNTKGKVGLVLHLKSGKRLLIGTQKGAEIENILKEVL
jgi:membrane protease YdiL (CAAX protease family)